jgi:hypothetical protein
MDFDEMWHKWYATGGYPKTCTYQFRTIGDINITNACTYEVGATVVSLNIGPHNDVW